ncbi:hypothetical protein H257_10230 [Aphanomyces astaci]|uniref:YncI copper-binding domain-containing protein n=1 Tax=Aphanomyces astaci TaxID=112090 RepID=W4G8U2_APHAT|nr:hypothetical protein H257_10230 [Aphanomyces astaci]ETV75378.1 hypothetical protein H257_10230 [Aphanomyces astaci]RQM25585.1 hypothetical protein B5M09_002858 [Aphanomyces astaci]|eukprot:XP_009835012.1 hypothetical protein H257_10230 [Aphanomyces astaci]
MHFTTVFGTLAALAASASAHVSLNPAVAAPNAYFVTIVRVPHSFPGAVTKNVSVDIPVGVASVKPQQVGGWKVATTTKTVNGTDVVSKVTWYDGSLPDELYQDFGLQFKVGDLPLNTTLYFPVTQETTPNGTLAWTSVPDDAGKLADAAHPAPKLTIQNATATTAAGAPGAASNSSNATPAPGKSSTITAAMSASVVALSVVSMYL